MAKLYFERIDKKTYQERKKLKHTSKRALFVISLILNVVLIYVIIAGRGGYG